MRAYIREDASLKTRKQICQSYIGIASDHLERAWLISSNVRIRRVTSTSILLELHGAKENVYWLWTKEV